MEGGGGNKMNLNFRLSNLDIAIHIYLEVSYMPVIHPSLP